MQPMQRRLVGVGLTRSVCRSHSSRSIIVGGDDDGRRNSGEADNGRWLG